MGMTTSQFRPKGGVGVAKPRGPQGFQPRYDNIFKVDPRIALKAQQREGRCIGNDDTCGARKAKGTDWCVGHMRSLGLLDERTEVTGDEGRTDHGAAGAD
jgi:hypothetical protein